MIIPFCRSFRLGDWPVAADVLRPCSQLVACRLQPATLVQTPNALLKSVAAHVEKQQQSRANLEEWQRMLTLAEAAAVASAHQVHETHQAAKDLQLRETTGHLINPPSLVVS